MLVHTSLTASYKDAPLSIKHISEGLIPSPLAWPALGIIREILVVMIIAEPTLPLLIAIVVVIVLPAAIILSMFIYRLCLGNQFLQLSPIEPDAAALRADINDNPSPVPFGKYR
jgi:hypothetical protein